MKKSILRKGLAIGIIVLFVGASVIPLTSSSSSQMDNDDTEITDPLYPELNGTIGENGWYISSVIITFIVDDDDITIRYKLDGDEWQEYECPLVIHIDGIRLFCWYYVRSHGNGWETSKVECIEIKIDQTDPTIDLDVEKIGDNTWLFTADVSDETSGINRVEFYVDGEYFTDTEAPFEWEYSGSGYTVQAVVYDNAGNSASEVIGRPVIKLEVSPFPSIHPFLKVYIHNIGDANATDVEWNFRWYGGWIFGERFNEKVRIDTGEHPFSLHPGSFLTIPLIKFGFGRVAIIISAKCAEGSSDTLMIEGIMMGFFFKIITIEKE